MDAEMKEYRTGINDGKERSSGPDWLRYADIIDKVRVEVKPLFKDSKDTKAIFGRYLRLNYIFKDPGDIIVDNLYTNLTNKFAELRRKRGAITRAELEAVVNSAISKGNISVQGVQTR